MNIVFPILAILFYGISPVFQKIALKKIPLQVQFLIHGITIFIIYSLIYLFFHDKPIDKDVIWAVCSGLCSVVGFIFYYEALKNGNASIITAITSEFPLICEVIFDEKPKGISIN